MLRLFGWLAGSKPPSAKGWRGANGNARKFRREKRENLDKILDLVVKMLDGQFFCERLTGWTQFVACMVAIHTLDVHYCLPSICEKLAQKAKAEKTSTEAKWRRNKEWMEESEHRSLMWRILRDFHLCVHEEKEPEEVVDQLLALPMPPGRKTVSEQEEAARLQRAIDAEEGDGFDLFEESDDGNADEFWKNYEPPRRQVVNTEPEAQQEEPQFWVNCGPSRRQVVNTEPEAQQEEPGPSRKRPREEEAWEAELEEVSRRCVKLTPLRDNIRSLVVTYAKLLQQELPEKRGEPRVWIDAAHADVHPYG
jgi:hypothetical protein